MYLFHISLNSNKIINRKKNTQFVGPLNAFPSRFPQYQNSMNERVLKNMKNSAMPRRRDPLSPIGVALPGNGQIPAVGRPVIQNGGPVMPIDFTTMDGLASNYVSGRSLGTVRPFLPGFSMNQNIRYGIGKCFFKFYLFDYSS